MTATAEELVGQADMLQKTIAFFKTAETTWNLPDRREGSFRPLPVAKAGARVPGKAERPDAEQGTGSAGNGASIGNGIVLKPGEQDKNDLDDEFERC